MVIEFPAGSTILIPSATLTHSNTPVRDGETRLSFTQFCAGGIFRYVDNGFRTEEEFEQQDPEGFSKMMQLKKVRWKMGLGLLSKIDDLAPLTAAP